MKREQSFQGYTRRWLLSTAVLGWNGLVGFSGNAYAEQNIGKIQQPDETSSAAFIRRAFELREQAAKMGDQAYGAVIVNASGEIVGQAPSRVVTQHDPTAHAEMEAIRDATRRLGTRDLSGHVIFASSRPCPMCEAAAYWANVSGMKYGRKGQDAGRPQLCH